jgi:hypothetical protein
MLAQLTLFAVQGGSGNDPSGTGGTIIIVAVVLAVLLAGAVLAKKAFTRGEMASKPSEDRPGRPDGIDEKKDPGVSHDPTAVGRPSDRGYEQKL